MAKTHRRGDNFSHRSLIFLDNKFGGVRGWEKDATTTVESTSI